MTQTMTARPALDIGRVFTRGFVLMGRAFVPVFLTTWSVGLLVALASFGLGQSLQGELARNQPGSGITPIYAAILFVAYGGWTLQYAMATCATTQGALMIENGEKPTIVGVFRRSLPRVIPVACVGVLYALAWAIGTLLLVVGGVVIRLLWIVAGPARAGESMMFLRAFPRSAALTSGVWTPIFFLQLIYGVAMMLLTGVAFLGVLVTALRVTTAAGGTMGSVLTPQGGAILLVYQVVTSAVFTLLLMLNASMPAALYVELRSLRDGFSNQRLDQVFS